LSSYHIDDMLATLDWLLPRQTKDIFSKAEWLLIVLSIYFHDMGLVVNEQEYQDRGTSGFAQFCEERLFASPSGADYKSKVDALPPERRERFLYQEFVRANHSRRVRCWIEGRPNHELGYAAAQMHEVGRLLSPLDADFRRDLGLVCESHNLDDIDNVTKYRVSHPYGNSDDETANLQYCAVLLRTIDLLQITRNRTPSVIYRLIDPADPLSQLEWAKQAAVKRVRAQVAVDRDGNASANLQSDTIEVFATFLDDNAFFGLTSYLRYAAEQIAASYNALQRSRRLTPRPYLFPWRYIDDPNVEVEGFVKQPFGFEIDQDKILDLLTGHTLYNDTNVVIRELAQNAIDATRLQAAIDHMDSSSFGKVAIGWNSATSELTVTDNGTGMTQDIIERHLLKVGASRYQDPKFREKYPTFSPISRFGIGILSSFMVADSVEIVTVSAEEEQARQISLRSVHGKYLIRLLDKNAEPLARSLSPHGTSVKIRLRPTARRFDLLEAVRRWVLFPLCQVTVTIDDNSPEKIGYRTPKEALEAYIARAPTSREITMSKFKVEETTIDGITLAYVMQYSSHFRDWSFLEIPQPSRAVGPPDLDGERPLTATCVEGIAVEFESPGFKGGGILAIANAVGEHAPKTNVARSSIEATDEKENMAHTVYRILFDAVAAEACRLRSEEAYSLTWAIEQIPFIITPALGQRSSSVQYPTAHQAALERVPIFLIENEDTRTEISISGLESLSTFWTVDSLLIRSVEHFIREAKAEVTASRLLIVSQGTSTSLPQGPVLANYHSAGVLRGAVETKFQITKMVGNTAERRLDNQWGLGSDIWVSRDRLRALAMRSGNREMYQAAGELGSGQYRRTAGNVFVPRKQVAGDGLSDFVAVITPQGLFLLPDTNLCNVFSLPLDITNVPSNTGMANLILMEAIAHSIRGARLSQGQVERLLRQAEEEFPIRWFDGRDALVAAFSDADLRIFNPLGWTRRESDGSEELEFPASGFH
jgi:molecular chaperone HtpG